MRCLTLADRLRAHGAHVVFFCRDLPGAMFGVLQDRGYDYARLDYATSDADWQMTDVETTIEASGIIFSKKPDITVIDHYGIDIVWENKFRSHTGSIMVIDDLANRIHDCDLLLDQNYYEGMETRYVGRIPQSCMSLLGPRYVLLRPEFAEARGRLRPRSGMVRRILVFFGGSDPDRLTHKAISALHSLDRPDITADIIVGGSNPHREEINAMCRELPNMTYHCQVSNMAELIAEADLAIGAGGATTWERCILGLPSITLVLAENQLATTRDLDRYGAVQFLGWADGISSEQLADAVNQALHDEERLLALSRKSLELMQDWHGADYVAEAAIKLMNKELSSDSK